MLDRFRVSAVDAVIEIDVARRDEEFRARALAAWADALYQGDRSADAVVVVPAATDTAAALASLSSAVTAAALAHRRNDRVWMLHAAGLADDEGRVVVLSAAPGVGKTTAARHLARRYAYVSDETVGIDDAGQVMPYRKPLSIIDRPDMPKTQVAPSSLDGGRTLPGHLRVARVVVLDRSFDGPQEPRLDRLDVTEALALLGPQSSYLAETESSLRRIAALLDATGGAVRLRYREVTDIDAIIDDLVRTPFRPVNVVPPRGTPNAVPLLRQGAYTRAEMVDELVVDDRIVLLRRTPTGGQVLVLDGIGPAIWAAADGSSVDEIVQAVIAAHGESERVDSRTAVAAALQDLVAAEVVRTA